MAITLDPDQEVLASLDASLNKRMNDGANWNIKHWLGHAAPEHHARKDEAGEHCCGCQVKIESATNVGLTDISYKI
jgi:hypothetical protein